MRNQGKNRLLTSLCEDRDQPLSSVTAPFQWSSKVRAFLSRDQREQSMRIVFTPTPQTMREPALRG